MSEAEEDMKKQVTQILKGLSADERELLAKIIQAERDKLYMKTPRGINDDIRKAVIEIIKKLPD
jgi:predicted YcjX-like family ATPase